MKIISLHQYPLKGARGLSHERMTIGLRGLAGDRRWMLVDENNRFLSQREVPSFATIITQVTDSGLSIKVAEEAPIDVALPDGHARINVTVWEDTVSAALADAAVNDALSARLGFPVRLVYMDERASRMADPTFAGAGRPVSFADGFPALITSEASSQALNFHIERSGGKPVPMARFRSNLVVDGDTPWAEDQWSVIKVGDVIFEAVKPCARCVVTTRDQKTGIGADDAQPIRALTQIRRSNDDAVKGVLFGVNLVPRNAGSFAIGASVEVLEWRETPWPVAAERH